MPAKRFYCPDNQTFLRAVTSAAEITNSLNTIMSKKTLPV
jgi:hypothetical protein